VDGQLLIYVCNICTIRIVIYVYKCMYVCIYICTHLDGQHLMNVREYMYMCIRIYVYVYEYVYENEYVYVCIYICMYACIYIYF